MSDLTTAEVAALEDALHEHLWGREYQSDEADCCVATILPIVEEIVAKRVNAATEPPTAPLAASDVGSGSEPHGDAAGSSGGEGA